MICDRPFLAAQVLTSATHVDALRLANILQAEHSDQILVFANTIVTTIWQRQSQPRASDWM